MGGTRHHPFFEKRFAPVALIFPGQPVAPVALNFLKKLCARRNGPFFRKTLCASSLYFSTLNGKGLCIRLGKDASLNLVNLSNFVKTS
jgi:hypothetical protein